MNSDFEQILRSDRLPSLPSVAIRVVEIVRAPEPDLDLLIQTVRSDPAICSKIMRTANSALFGLRQRVRAIEHAVPVLGAKLVRTLVLSFSLVRTKTDQQSYSDFYQYIWRTCLAQAVTNEALAGHLKTADGAEYFVAGLLQDVGMLGMMAVLPNRYAMCLDGFPEFSELIELEREEFEFSHLDVSIEMARRWSLDEKLIGAISLHHEEPAERRRFRKPPPPMVLCCQVSSILADAFEHPSRSKMDSIRQVLSERFDITGESCDGFLRDISVRIAEMAALFSVDIGSNFMPDDLLDEAREELQSIALESQLESIAATKESVAAQVKLEAEKQELAVEASRDAMTGVLNRVHLLKALEQVLSEVGDGSLGTGVLFLDIDKFKKLNDTYGHLVGDDAIVSLSESLRHATRDHDLIGRYGGDEFIVVLVGVTSEIVSRASERLRKKASAGSVEFEGNKVSLAISVGGVYVPPDVDLDIEEIISKADQAMYIAKKRGGDRVEIMDLSETRLIDA